MEEQLKSLEWKGFEGSRLNNQDRCLQKGLESILHGNVHRGAVVPSRNFLAHKLSGTSSRSLKSLYQRQGADDCLPADGQYVCSTLHKRNQRYKIPRSVLFSTRSLALVSTTQDSCGSQVSTRHIEYSGGQGVQSYGGASRLETTIME